jgi:hypothetical protein
MNFLVSSLTSLVTHWSLAVYRAITIKTAWHWHKTIQENQWIRIEDPGINPHIYSQLIFDKGAQNK